METALLSCPDIELTLVGETPNLHFAGRIKDYVKEKGLEQNIHFVEFIDPAQFHAYLSNFDAFIHPSCYAADRDCEGGAPIVLLDAQATGLPVISTNHCDIPMEVIHKKTGWLSDEKDVADLAKGIEWFYQMEQSEYEVISNEARRHVLENFSIQESGHTLAKHYQKLLKG